MLTHADLDLVAAIASAGRMKQAAERLQAHPATVYRRLEALERRLGSPLFERIDGQLLPTALAETVVASAGEIAARLDALNRSVGGRDNRLTGTLRITTTDTLCAMVMPVIAAFAQEHRAIAIEVVVANAVADMARNEADIAIRPTRAPSEILVGQRVGGFEFAAYAAGPYPSCDLTALLASRRWIGLSGALKQIPVARWLDRNVPRENLLAGVDSIVAAALAARSGACAMLPAYLGDDPIYGLERLSGPVPELHSELWLLTHPDLRHAARIRAFMGFAARSLREKLR